MVPTAEDYLQPTRKQKITAASWFKTAFGSNGKKRGKDDALDSYRQILRMVRKGD